MIDRSMRCYPNFLEYLEWRSGVGEEGEPPKGLEGDVTDESLAGRRSPFRGLFKVVNPARPASPLNSKLLASPWKKRLKGQVMGR